MLEITVIMIVFWEMKRFCGDNINDPVCVDTLKLSLKRDVCDVKHVQSLVIQRINLLHQGNNNFERPGFQYSLNEPDFKKTIPS